ncbi:MAG: FG-GAP-like repeat-containing protein [Phycisphaerales bacterium]
MEANGIARWDGLSWSALSDSGGTGVNGAFFSIRALTVFDAGQGAALYAGGDFTSAGGVEAKSIARWDAFSWSALTGSGGMGVDGQIRALTEFNDGAGVALYAGGNFTTADGVEVNRIARWDGFMWSALTGPGGTGVSGQVNALAVFDDGGGPALYAGGNFTTAGGVTVNRIAKWDGIGWSALAGPSGVGVSGGPPSAGVDALAVFDDGSGPALYAGGAFTTAGGVTVNRIARWDGSSWSALTGPGGTGVNSTVRALTVFDDGTGSALYAGGGFITAGGVTVNNIARWDGSEWSALTGPVGTGVSDQVNALAVFDDGGGQALYAGGDFSAAGWIGVPANKIAKWNGSIWSALTGPGGNGITDDRETYAYISALTVFDNGAAASPGLYVGGRFTTAGGVTVNHIARWDGNTWHALTGRTGSGVSGGTNLGSLTEVSAVLEFDPDGHAGPAAPRLMVGGEFSGTASGQASAYFAQFGESTNLWAAPSGGQFEDPSKWLCDRALSAFDEFIIDATLTGYSPTAFALAFPGDPEPQRARMLTMRTDIVSLNLAGQSFELTEGTTSIARPGLVIGEYDDLGASLTVRNFGASQPLAGLSVGAMVIADGPTLPGFTINNRLQVQDPASFLAVAGDAYVGRRGNRGDLVVQGSAIATIDGIISIGTELNAVGEIRVLNTGTEFWHSAAFPSGTGRSMAIGQSGTGSFRVGGPGLQAGAQAASLDRLDTLTLGTNAGGAGTATISGAGSQWTLDSRLLRIGLSGSGTINIFNGGLLDTDTLEEVRIGINPSSTGLVSLVGNGARWIENRVAITVGPTGTLSVGAGAVVESPALLVLPGGTLTGDGQIGSPGSVQNLLADVINLGTLAPDEVIFEGEEGAGIDGEPVPGAGTLTIVGDYRQIGPPPGGSAALAGSLRVRVGADGQSDRLDVLGTAEIAGGLFIELDEGYQPMPGESFEVFTAGAVNPNAARFDVALMPGLTDGRYMRLQYQQGAAAGQGLPDGTDGPENGFPQGAIVTVDLLSNLLGFGDPDEVGVDGTPTALAVGDLDGDARDDIAITLLGPSPTDPGSVLVLYNDGDGTSFSAQQFPVGAQPSGIALGDLRGLGILDIAVTNAGSNTVSLLSNTGASFAPGGTISVGSGPADIVADAFAAPGVVDLVIANALDGTVQRLANNGLGVFTPQTPIEVGLLPVALAAGDVDNSGVPDVAVALSGDDAVLVLLNLGGGMLDPQPKIPVGTDPTGIGIEELEFDKDLDQRLSIVAINAGSDDVSIVVGDGAGTFAPPVNLPLGGQPRSLAGWDMDGDGDTDLAIVVNDDELGPLVRILRNDTEEGSGQIVLAPAEDVGVGEAPLLVSSGDLSGDASEELVTLNDDTAAAAQAQAQSDAGGDADGPTTPTTLRFRPAMGPSSKPCPGDLNADQQVNSDDLAILLSAFGTSSKGDLNDDGKTNSDDLGILLSAFGAMCG